MGSSTGFFLQNFLYYPKVETSYTGADILKPACTLGAKYTRTKELKITTVQLKINKIFMILGLGEVWKSEDLIVSIFL